MYCKSFTPARFSDLSISCFSLTVRTPQCAHTVWGKNTIRTIPYRAPKRPHIQPPPKPRYSNRPGIHPPLAEAKQLEPGLVDPQPSRLPSDPQEMDRGAETGRQTPAAAVSGALFGGWSVQQNTKSCIKRRGDVGREDRKDMNCNNLPTEGIS